MMWKTNNYNLLYEEWIPVLYKDGKFKRVGIKTALTEAHLIRQIAASNPLDQIALMRFLLVVLQWCKPKLSEPELWELQNIFGIPQKWLAKLENEEVIFNLLGDGQRFMQQQEGKFTSERPVTDIFHELPSGTNIAHFCHIRDYKEGVCPACIALGLVRLPIAMTVMGRGKRPGINGDPPLYFLPFGSTLFETLKNNWPLESIDGDQPCWVPNQRHPTKPEVGILEGFTWTSRQYRIADDGLQNGICIICGTKSHSLVTKLYEYNEPNGRSDLSRCDTDRWCDPHIAYCCNEKKNKKNEDNKKNKKKPYRARDSEKDLPFAAGEWREIIRLCLKMKENDQCSIRCISDILGKKDVRIFAGALISRQAKSIETMSRVIYIAQEDPERYLVTVNALCDVIEKIVDPYIRYKKESLQRFKERHLLRFLNNEGKPLPDSVRCVLAAWLPHIESVLSKYYRVKPDIITDLLKSLMDKVVHSTILGSSLRKGEAIERTWFRVKEELKLLHESNKEIREISYDPF